MESQIPEFVKNIIKHLTAAKFQAYIVGGAVRDLIMAKSVSDWDFTTDASPEEILKVFPNGFLNNKFGTVAILDNNNLYEITTMRKEGVYEDFRHPTKVSWTNNIEEDLSRRDFTINALALSSDFKTIIDPYQGQSDIKEKIIKAVGNPNQRFEEDALRLIRAIRIASQIDFKIEKLTFKAIYENAHLIEKISWERIRDEVFEILISKNAVLGFRLLKETRLLAIILPELEKTFGVIQEGPKHDRTYDIGEHSLMTMNYTPTEDPILKFAALLHDIGKVPTYKLTDGNTTFYGHDAVGGEMVKAICKRFHLSKKDSDRIYKLVRFHLFTVDEKQTDSALRRFIRNIGRENLSNMLLLREGDRLGGGTQNPTSWRLDKFKVRIKQLLKKPFTISDLKVSGFDVMEILNIPPGKKVGQILNTLFEEVLEDASKNNKEYLLERIKSQKE